MMQSGSIPDHELAALLATADRRTLAAAVTHLAGNPHAIHDIRDQAALLRVAVEVMGPYLRGERQVEPPSDEVLQAAMDIAAGEPVDPEYLQLAREQMGIGPIAPRPPLHAPDGFNIVVVGSGISGILAGLTLRRLGFTNFVILEKAGGPGGTWRQNTYPGCRVDTPSLLYSFSFALDFRWPEHFSHQPALLEYINHIVERTGIGHHIHYDSSVEELRWDEAQASWHIEVRRDNGSIDLLSANVVIGALGLLRVAKYPKIDGVETFAGPSFHSTNWDHSVDLAGKRVAVIGTGASANQIVPAIAPTVEEVIVYQRSPPWVLGHPQYGKLITGDEQRLIEEMPAYRQWYRVRQFLVLGDRSYAMLKVDPAWPHPERAANEVSDRFRIQLTEYVERELVGRDDLIEKVLPTYPVFGKRMLLDNGWYKTLRRDNVHLVTSPIQRITPDGVTTLDGHDEVDVVVYATGFQTDRVLYPLAITGSDGVDVRAQLDAEPEAYLGMAIEHCPNLFAMPGPNGMPGHGGNSVFFAECQVEYITEVLRTMFDNSFSRVEIKPAAVRAFVDDIIAELDTLIWGTQDTDNWFRGDRNRVVAVLPKRILDLWHSTREVDTEAYDWS